METKNEKCCFMQFPYPEKSVYFFAVGKSKNISLDDILNNKLKEKHQEYVNSFKNVYMVARSIEDAEEELLSNLPAGYQIYGSCNLWELMQLQKNNYSIENHDLLDFYNRKTKREICYYKSTTSKNFIKVEGQLDDIKRYLLSYGEGLLINKKEHSALLNNLTLVQKGKLFGHYCLSKEEEEELEYITDEPELTTNCYQQ